MSASRELVLIRHSVPELDPAVPASRWVLSERGRREAEALARALAQVRLQRLVTSREPKARETAEILRAYLGIEASVWPDLHEHARESVPLYPSETAFRRRVIAAMRRPEQRLLGEESMAQARRRFERAVAAAREQHAGEALGIVSHGTVISLLVAGANGLAPEAVWAGLAMASFVVVRASDFRLLAGNGE